MDKEQYLKNLKANLHKLSGDEINDIVGYYSEYIDDLYEKSNTKDIVGELGTPEHLASQLLGDMAVTKIKSKNIRGKFSGVWIAILALTALPIGLPLVITFAAVIFSCFVALLSILFSLFMVSGSLIFAAVVTFLSSFIILFTTFQIAVTIFYIGVSLVLLGIGIILWTLSVRVSVVLFSGFSNLIKRIFRRRGLA